MKQFDTKSNWLIRASIIVTFLWIVAAMALAFSKDAFGASASEIGDFFAGVFAPPAFYWLVLGFFQQSTELRLQARELKLTRDEISRQSSALEKADERAQRDMLVKRFENQLLILPTKLHTVFRCLVEIKRLPTGEDNRVAAGFQFIESEVPSDSPAYLRYSAGVLKNLVDKFSRNYPNTFLQSIESGYPDQAARLEEIYSDLALWGAKMSALSETIEDNRWQVERENYGLDIVLDALGSVFPNHFGSHGKPVFADFDAMISPNNDKMD